MQEEEYLLLVLWDNGNTDVQVFEGRKGKIQNMDSLQFRRVLYLSNREFKWIFHLKKNKKIYILNSSGRPDQMQFLVSGQRGVTNSMALCICSITNSLSDSGGVP